MIRFQNELGKENNPVKEGDNSNRKFHDFFSVCIEYNGSFVYGVIQVILYIFIKQRLCTFVIIEIGLHTSRKQYPYPYPYTYPYPYPYCTQVGSRFHLLSL